ncbi:unnamed protein product [Diabrotica balteata]|uniref:Uncharacterized protein n=1 Tax=Diabrotica balteata TaxID=107213 RepID=A0A9N9TCY3_DIABA|nr:unnamed protein product [Diabrotica balteata]
MHKITKGLKKKKKGKKSKKGEEELFKPEELENYRKEHQGTSEEPAGQNEEWKKFLALTSGVDDILKKTQGDLDRIKSTSFFQRKPTESEVRKVEEEKLAQEQKAEEAKRELEPPTPSQLGISRIPKYACTPRCRLKLAYIPESPTLPNDGDDPFDTSAAEKAILGPEFERKGKKLVPLGAAVEVLTGRVQLPTCATKRPTPNKRQILKEKDLLLQSFDENIPVSAVVADESGLNLIKPEDRDLLGGSHSDLANSVSISKTAFKPVTEIKVLDNESDDEFDPRAEEQPRSRTVSRPDVLNITGSKTVSFDLPSPDLNTLNTESKIIKPLTPFYTRKVSIPEVPISEDPFDTSFASNVTPGKIELRLIENELFDPNLEKKLSINDNNFNPRDEAQSKVDKVVNTIKEISKPKPPSTSESIDIDLLAIDNDIPVKVLTPGASIEQTEELSYCDPFDTSIASNILPGRVELKLLESELIPSVTSSSTIVNKDLLIHDADEVIEKPLSPSAQVSSTVVFDTFDETYDPFDTSCALDIQPGRAELKVLESEFIHNGC